MFLSESFCSNYLFTLYVFNSVEISRERFRMANLSEELIISLSLICLKYLGIFLAMNV